MHPVPAKRARPQPKSPIGRIFANTAWLLGGKGFGALCGLAYLAILTRSLGLKDFGHFSLIFGTAQALITIAGFQTWRVVVRYGAPHVHEADWNKFGRLGMLCGVLDAVGAIAGCVIAFVVIYGFAGVLDLNPRYIDTAFYFSCAMVWAIVSAPTGIVRALHRFDMAVYVEAVVPVGRLLAAVIIWWTGPTVARFLFAWALIDLIEAACYWGMARWLCPKAIRFDHLKDWRLTLAENPGIERFFMVTYAGATLDAVMRNGPLLGAFEPLASFVAVPRYGTLDPTPLLGITLPAFIGLMVGDAGYGLLLMGVLVLAHGRWPAAPAMRLLWPVGLASTAAMIAFGILFGEWFGETGRHLGVVPVWFDRRESIPALLALATSIGVAQVGLGLALGVVNARRLGHRREAVGRGALLAGLASLLVLLLVAFGAAPVELATVAGAALALATVLLVLTLGIVGPIDLLGVVGNVLSYARLMAIGLAGVMLALVADRLAAVLPSAILGLLVAAVIHGLNLVLGVFDASIQGLRLHYVEFFTKFVEPGGTRYAPFAWTLAGGDGHPAPSTPALGASTQAAA